MLVPLVVASFVALRTSATRVRFVALGPVHVDA